MKEKLTFLDLWDINNKKITDFPKELHKGYKLRKEQSKYKFNTKNNSILNIFRNLQNQPSNIINPQTFCISIKKIINSLSTTACTGYLLCYIKILLQILYQKI